jgi:DNA-binding transcriptional ArsR family regulator
VPGIVRPDLPADAEQAIEALGHRVRAAALRSLLLEGPATATALAKRVALGRPLIQRHLAALERLEVVAREPQHAHSDHRSQIFRANRERIEAMLAALGASFRG